MKSVNRRCLAALVILAGLFALSTPGLALLVKPVVIEMTSTGTGASAALEVVNDRNVPMTVEVKVQDLALPEKGAPQITPAKTDDFMIFPTIAKIPAGSRQVFRVRYIGNPVPEKSRLFMFSTSELPVSIDSAEKRAQLQVLYSINSVVAVRPPNAKADIRIESVHPATGDKGATGVEVTFANSGAAHGFIGRASMSMTSSGWSKSFDADTMSKAFGLGLIPARSKRRIFVALPDRPAGTISATLKPGV